jgi:hypothetical protein
MSFFIDRRWELGDWWNECLNYGNPKIIVGGDDWDGPSLKSCIRAGVVARQFDKHRRRHSLKWGHHYEIICLSEETQDFLLTESELGGYSVKTLRDRVKKWQDGLVEL